MVVIGILDGRDEAVLEEAHGVATAYVCGLEGVEDVREPLRGKENLVRGDGDEPVGVDPTGQLLLSFQHRRPVVETPPRYVLDREDSVPDTRRRDFATAVRRADVEDVRLDALGREVLEARIQCAATARKRPGTGRK
jgi:hypothetical protein